MIPVLFYDDMKDNPGGRIRIHPSFLALSGTVGLTGCSFDEAFVQTDPGTCFDAHLNREFNCTVAV